MLKCKSFVHILIVSFIFFCNTLYSQDRIPAEQLFNMSLDELMNVTVKMGNITGLSLSKTPVSITTITSRDIELTPARNLYDLLEIYVPGAYYYNHYDSPHIGVRGIITDRNYKFLLLVNGRNMNLKAHNGATSEMEMWDLNDIDHIEVIRGPGSVTYGPGAVAGIINIITKRANGETSLNVKTNYVYPYNSTGLSLNFTKPIGNNNLLVYAGIQNTEGYENPTVIAPLPYNTFGDLNKYKDYKYYPIDYFYDYGGLPQLKFFADYSFGENWDFSVRYTRQGAALNHNFAKAAPQVGFDSLGNIVDGKPVNLTQNQDQHFTISLSNIKNFQEQFEISSLISLSSEYYIRRTEWFRKFPQSLISTWDSVKVYQDLDGIWTHDYDFSESSLLGSFILNKSFDERLKIAVGTELSYNFWGPGWMNDRTNFKLGDNQDIISGEDSKIYGSKFDFVGVPAGSGYFVGNGWNTFTFSFLFETMWEPVENITLLISARSDKDTYSKLLFSPRFAVIYEITEYNVLKLVAQRSQRMNTASQLLIQHLSNKSTDPETLNGIELIYSGLLSDNLQINTSIFYNELDIISWYNVGRTTRLTGELELHGIEFELKYIGTNYELGLNQSFVKQVKWKLSDSVLFSGISYSDYKLDLGDITFDASGNDINNWSNFSTKLYFNYRLFNDKMTLHLDSRIYWKFEGSLEGKNSFINAMKADSKYYDKMKDILEVMDKEDMYGTDFRVNFSASYKINDKIETTFMAMNIFGYGDNKRYFYDSGIRKPDYFQRHGFIKEPLTLALKLGIKL